METMSGGGYSTGSDLLRVSRPRRMGAEEKGEHESHWAFRSEGRCSPERVGGGQEPGGPTRDPEEGRQDPGGVDLREGSVSAEGVKAWTMGQVAEGAVHPGGMILFLKEAKCRDTQISIVTQV